MAFANKLGNILKQAKTCNSLIYQSIRCMSSSKLFVGGLSYSTDDQSLKDAFCSFGEVIDAKVILDRETGRSRGFGFITFTSSEEASAAITGMDGKDLHGRMVRVNYAAERTGGFRGGSGYGGGGGYSGGGGYGGSNYGGDSYNRGGGGASGGGAYGGGASGGYGGNNYGCGRGGGYGGGSSGGGSDSYVSGTVSDGFTSGGGAGGYSAGGTMGYGSGGGDTHSSNQGSAFGSYNNQDDPVEDNYKDEDDEPDDYAKKQS